LINPQLGDSIFEIFSNQEYKNKFLNISKNCSSVICCRVSPSQKAEIVNLIKNGINKICLAIGDGGNDVAM
jgi:phospholipid-translocating ATPase